MDVFSSKTGDIVEYPDGDLLLLDPDFQFPLKEGWRRGSCRKCYDRLHVGRNRDTRKFLPCPKCCKRRVDFDGYGALVHMKKGDTDEMSMPPLGGGENLAD